MAHPRNAGYISGDGWVECPRCHFDYRRSQMKQEWTGLWVCELRCWEPRHPGDFVIGVPDNSTPPQPVYPPIDDLTETQTFADHGMTAPEGTFTP